jgi:hypothetical protein
LFDEPVPTFGRFQVTAALGDGRFGPVHLGVDPKTDQVVVIRTFTEQLSAEQQQRLVDALQRLCAQPLDHASIATPIACGLEHGFAYLTHSYLPGTSVDEFLRTHGPRPLAEVAVRVTHLAAAIDFAAAADVHHGTLSPRDIIFAPQSTGVSGFGLVQAIRDAGVDIESPTTADDIYALAAMTFELLIGYRFAGGSVRDALAPLRGAVGVDYEGLVTALEPTLSGEPATWPATALAFAASLHAAQTQARVTPSTVRIPASDVGRLSFGTDDVPPPAPMVAEPERIVPVPAAPLPARRSHHAETDDRASLRLAPTWEEPVAPASPFDAPLHGVVADEAPLPDQQGEPLVLRPHAEHSVPAPAPVFMQTVESTSGGSGWRVMALGGGVALLVLIAVVVWVFSRGGQTQTPGGPAADTTVSEPAERVDDRPVVAPNSDKPVTSSTPQAAPASVAPSSPAASTPTAPTNVPPVIQEPPARQTATPAPQPTHETAASSSKPHAERRAAAPPAAPRHAAAASTAHASSTRPERAAPASPRQAGTDAATLAGRILVRSTPAGATVVVDGVPRGQTPAAVRELTFGSHVIVVTAVGYPQWQQTFTLTEERPSQSFEAALDGGGAAASATPGGLQIDSRPSGAQVFVDGAPVGMTPVQVPGIGAGAHAIRIELTGYRPWSTSVNVTNGQRTRVAASLEQ